MTVAELTRTLEHPNAWWRETAQRLLLERRDRSAVPLLRTAGADQPSRGRLASMRCGPSTRSVALEAD